MYPVLEHRPTWIEIDLQQFRQNLAYIKTQAQEKEVWPVVKSDAYNNGVEGLFGTFVEAGITKFCVAQYDEAVQLQQIADVNDIAIDLIIFGYIPSEALLTFPTNWRMTIANQETLTTIASLELTHTIKVHLKVDSGMNRKGFKTKDAFTTIYQQIKQHPKLEVEGIYTHFSTADSDLVFMQEQINRFKAIAGAALKSVRYVHAQNSYGLLHAEEKIFNLVRPGGICYGMTGVEHEAVKPIFSLYTTITDKKVAHINEVIGYGNTHTFQQVAYIGVLPIGYADGWRKKNTNLTVYVNDKPCQIVGKICMEQCMISATQNIFAVGDVVELIGKHNSIFTVATYNEICDYELVCSFLARVPRKYRV